MQFLKSGSSLVIVCKNAKCSFPKAADNYRIRVYFDYRERSFDTKMTIVEQYYHKDLLLACLTELEASFNENINL